MEPALLPCDRCDRHVRADASACPFCAAPRVAQSVSALEVPRDLSRAARVALGAAALMVGCRSTTPNPDVQTTPPTSILQPYGVPIQHPTPEELALTAVAWALTVSDTTTNMASRETFRLGISATNGGSGPVRPDRGRLGFFVNGERSMAAELAFSNGATDRTWSELAPGATARDERALGTSLFPAPGEYDIELRQEGRVVGRQHVRVVADGPLLVPR